MNEGDRFVVKVWGHRGCRGSENPPENSIAAFQEAFRQSADGIELDVFPTRSTQDDPSRLVVFHDDRLERMTTGQGAITTYTWRELKGFYLKDNAGIKVTRETIPTLDSVLDAVEGSVLKSGAVVNIEAKEIKGGNMSAFIAGAIQRKLAAGWKRSNFLVSSFDMGFLRGMRMVDKTIPVGVLLASDNAPWDIEEKILSRHLLEIRDIKPDYINITLPSLTDRVAGMIRDFGADPIAWTYDEVMPTSLSEVRKRELVRCLTRNAAVIITDYPAPMRQVIESYP